MVEISYEEMYKLMENGRKALTYAWEHYDALTSRTAFYTLYGSADHFWGPLVPNFHDNAKPCILTEYTRKQSYTVYELDQNCDLLRIKYIRKGQVDCIYHVFDMDGVTYAQPFWREEKKLYPQCTMAAKYIQNQLVYSALTEKDRYLCVDFFAFPKPTWVTIKRYLFIPNGTVAPGVPKNHDAPFGAWDSPVTLDFYEGPYRKFDFKEFLNSVHP